MCLLYELLTGTTPFDQERLKTVAFDEIRRIIREEEPPRPSMRLSSDDAATTTASFKRGSDPRRLSQLIRGELDWIVMKCLEKDRNRRYETANGLAMDLRRYLNNEPVQACPPSLIYRLRMFVRRNRASIGTVASSWQSRFWVLALHLAGVSSRLRPERRHQTKLALSETAKTPPRSERVRSPANSKHSTRRTSLIEAVAIISTSRSGPKLKTISTGRWH